IVFAEKGHMPVSAQIEHAGNRKMRADVRAIIERVLADRPGTQGPIGRLQTLWERHLGQPGSSDERECLRADWTNNPHSDRVQRPAHIERHLRGRHRLFGFSGPVKAGFITSDGPLTKPAWASLGAWAAR